MATIEELKGVLEQIAVQAQAYNERLDAINVKIDEMRAAIVAGGVVNQVQLDELAAIASAAKASLDGIGDDLLDAEQS